MLIIRSFGSAYAALRMTGGVVLRFAQDDTLLVILSVSEESFALT